MLQNQLLAKQDESALRTLIPPTSAAPALWSLRPVSNPAIPKIAGAKHPVDAFILKGLKAKGISVNPPATQVAWLRRITVDLTGLPPTAAESSIFLADKSGNARQKVVDRLLAPLSLNPTSEPQKLRRTTLPAFSLQKQNHRNG